MKHLPVPHYSLLSVCGQAVPVVTGPVSAVAPQQCRGLSQQGQRGTGSRG